MGQFRYDINALRALAIASVLLFHFRLGPVGGFAGVDVFFVVSGFLMTGIVWGRLKAGRFGLLDFYAARARRIVPALAVMCAVFLLFGLVWFDPLALTELGHEMTAALLFWSNIQFWQEAGYFDAIAGSKPLLHTWSLSVEWQFYLAYPLLMMGLHRWARGVARHCVLGAALVSFALAVVLAGRRPDFDFFMLPTRAWEMAAGGLPLLYGVGPRMPGRLRAGMASAGLALIVAAMLLIDDTISWPAWATLAPVAGTVAVIVADLRDAAPFRFAPVRLLGAWSYSLYLWHWPVLVALAYFDGDGLLGRLSALGLVVALSALSYYGVEQRGLRWLNAGHRAVTRGAWVGFAGVVAAAILTVAGTGFPTRFGGSRAQVEQARAAEADWAFPSTCGNYRARTGELPLCTLGQGTRRVLVLGDSFAEQLYPRMAALASRDPTLQIRFATSGGCSPVPGVGIVRPGSTCDAFGRLARAEALGDHYDVVVIASVWLPYFRSDDEPVGGVGITCFETDGRCRRPGDPAALQAAFAASFDRLADFAAALRRQGTKVVIVEATPVPPVGSRDYPADLVRRAFLRLPPDPATAIDLADFRRRAAFVASQLQRVSERSGAVLFDPASSLCGAAACPTTGPDGVSLYKDSAHLRASAVVAAPFGALDALLSGADAAPDSDTNVLRATAEPKRP